MMSATLLRQISALALLGLAACQASVGKHSNDTPGVLDAQVMQAISTPVAAAQSPYIGDDIAPGVIILQPDLWREMRSGFVLERHMQEKRVQQELRWLIRHPNYLNNLQPRMARYLAYIHQQVKARGLPSELALLPIVESALDPYAFSHGGAAGLWQFIPATGKRFGLQRNWWYDGRRDPVASTEAALDLLQYLNKRFDDWYLALAGYNAGEGNVGRAQRRANNGATFWQLKLPRETSAYVPRLLALVELVAHPEKYGISLPDVSPGIPFRIIDTQQQVDLSVAAQATEIDIDTLYSWNPALNQWATPPSGPNRLLIPIEFSEAAQQQLWDVPKDARVQWLRIQVESGDTLSQLAQRHHTDVASLRKANNLRGNQIREGHSLLIPKSRQALSNPVAARTAGATYRVKSGDSLWTISRAHGVPINKLMKTNHIGPKETLRIGQQITLPGVKTPTTNTISANQTSARKAVIRKVHYGVRRGDSLARIASKFNVQISEIVSWNQIDRSKYLQPGQSLMLYVTVSASGGD